MFSIQIAVKVKKIDFQTLIKFKFLINCYNCNNWFAIVSVRKYWMNSFFSLLAFNLIRITIALITKANIAQLIFGFLLRNICLSNWRFIDLFFKQNIFSSIRYFFYHYILILSYSMNELSCICEFYKLGNH